MSSLSMSSSSTHCTRSKPFCGVMRVTMATMGVCAPISSPSSRHSAARQAALPLRSSAE